MTASRGLLAWTGAMAALALGAGCGHSRDFVWVDQLPRSTTAPDAGTHQLQPGDLIGIRVFNQEANSIDRTRVREDGRISLPFLNDVEVAGLEPSGLARHLEAKLRTYIQNPVVTVVVHERRALRVSVVGQVTRTGAYDLDDGAGVVHALAAAGGLTPFAKDDRIFVLRSGNSATGHSSTTRIRFRYADLRRGVDPAAAFRLRRGDIVVVE
jgi:polysaccharide export outer membrane protein